MFNRPARGLQQVLHHLQPSRLADIDCKAVLTLAGPACNTYGQDIEKLKLEITQETGDRLHVKIYDADENVYQVPESVLPRPSADGNVSSTTSQLVYDVVNDPFSFSVSRRSGGQALFNTTGAELIFQSQYLRVRTQLPEIPHLYGLGEHSDPFQVCCLPKLHEIQV